MSLTSHTDMIGIREGQVTEMSYNKYQKEMKDAVVSRMLSGEETVTDINRETGININTLYRWRDASNDVKENNSKVSKELREER